MENRSLRVGAYSLISAVCAAVFKLSILPSLVSADAGRDAWISVTVIAALEIITLVPVVFVSFHGGLQAIKEKYGNIAYIAIIVPIIAVLMIKTLVYLAEVNSFCGSYLFYNESVENVGIVFSIAAAFIAVTGIKGISRAATIALWSIPLIFIVGLAFGEPAADFSKLLPVGVTGLKGFAGIDNGLFFTFDMAPLMLISAGENDEKLSQGTVFSVTGVIYVLIILFFAAFTAVFGGAYYLSPHALSSMGSFNVVNTEIGAVDWPAIVAWLSFALIQISLQIWAVTAALTPLGFKPKITAVVAAAVAATSGFIFKNIEKTLIFAESMVKYFTVGITVVCAVVAAILIKIKVGTVKGAEYAANI